MSRKLRISYDRPGLALRKITVLVDDTTVCTLKNHESFEAELSEGEHAIILKLGGIPILKGTVSSGKNDWTLSYEQFAANFILSESKPFYGKQL